jgi:hypothetical protein
LVGGGGGHTTRTHSVTEYFRSSHSVVGVRVGEKLRNTMTKVGRRQRSSHTGGGDDGDEAAADADAAAAVMTAVVTTVISS